MLSFDLHGSRDFFPAHYFDSLQQLWQVIGWSERRVRSHEEWSRCLQASRHILFVWEGNQLVGFGRIVEDGIFATFYDIAVDPRFQRQGIGTQLMKQLINQLRGHNYAGIYLFSWNENPANKGFYKKLGFVESHDGMELVSLMNPE